MILVTKHSEERLLDFLTFNRHKVGENDPRYIHRYMLIELSKVKSLEHVRIKDNPEVIKKISDIISDIIKDAKQVYIFDDNDIIITSNSIKHSSLEKITNELRDIHELDIFGSGEAKFGITVFETPKNSQSLAAFCKEKIKSTIEKTHIIEEDYKINKIKNLTKFILNMPIDKELFKYAKQRSINSRTSKILVLDHSRDSRTMLSNFLHAKYQVFFAKSAIDAINLYVDSVPDIFIISDDSLKDGSVPECEIEKILNLDPDAYIVIVAQDIHKNDLMDYLNKGVKGVIEKPFSRDTLLVHIEKFIKLHRTQLCEKNA